MPIDMAAFAAPTAPPEPEPTAFGLTTRKKPRFTKKLKERLAALTPADMPDNDLSVPVVFTATGTTGERPWTVALELWRQEKVELSEDLTLRAIKIVFDPEATTDFKPLASAIDPSTPRSNDAGPAPALPPLAIGLDMKTMPIGMPVRIGTEDQYELAYVGYDGFATKAQPDLTKARAEGLPVWGDPAAMEATQAIIAPPPQPTEEIQQNVDEFLARAQQRAEEDDPQETLSRIRQAHDAGDALRSVPEAAAAVTPPAVRETQQIVPATANHEGTDAIGRDVVKITFGFLEKINLGDYNSLQVGPVTISRTIVDSGRRITWEEAGIPIAPGDEASKHKTISVDVARGLIHAAEDTEAIMRAQRQNLVDFLESARGSVS